MKRALIPIVFLLVAILITVSLSACATSRPTPENNNMSCTPYQYAGEDKEVEILACWMPPDTICYITTVAINHNWGRTSPAGHIACIRSGD